MKSWLNGSESVIPVPISVTLVHFPLSQREDNPAPVLLTVKRQCVKLSPWFLGGEEFPDSWLCSTGRLWQLYINS